MVSASTPSSNASQPRTSLGITKIYRCWLSYELTNLLNYNIRYYYNFFSLLVVRMNMITIKRTIMVVALTTVIYQIFNIIRILILCS